MKTARIVVLGVALASGGGAALMLSNRSPQPPAAMAAPGPVFRTVEVLVARGDVAMGQTLRAEDLHWISWPADALPTGLVTRASLPNGADEFVGAIARNPFYSGEPIRREKVIKGNAGFMSAILPSGMRAIAISIDTRGATSAGGFILPNDRVDVIQTRRPEGSDTQVSEIILSNVRILAIGQTVQERNGEKVVTGETATLELTPAQAEMVVLAQKVGQLSLALRSLADASDTGVLARPERSESLRVIRYGVTHQAAQ